MQEQRASRAQQKEAEGTQELVLAPWRQFTRIRQRQGPCHSQAEREAAAPPRGLELRREPRAAAGKHRTAGDQERLGNRVVAHTSLSPWCPKLHTYGPLDEVESSTAGRERRRRGTSTGRWQAAGAAEVHPHLDGGKHGAAAESSARAGDRPTQGRKTRGRQQSSNRRKRRKGTTEGRAGERGQQQTQQEEPRAGKQRTRRGTEATETTRRTETRARDHAEREGTTEQASKGKETNKARGNPNPAPRGGQQP